MTRSPVKLEITTEAVRGGWQAQLLVNDEPVATFTGKSEIPTFKLAEEHVRAIFRLPE